MIVSTKHQFVFVGINKTGTTSVEAMLSPYRSRIFQKYLRIRHRQKNHDRPAFKHLPANMARSLIGRSRWDRYFTFTFVRNPWARVLSEYSRHRHDYGSNDTLKDGFTRWVLDGGNWLARENTMASFVKDENGNVIMDFVGKTESLDSDLEEICSRIGIDSPEIRYLNQSENRMCYRDIYTNETRDLVTEWVADDATLFGYEF
jgi:hypothetical protein